MLLLIGSFIAGILTVLAPCVLPLLPIIIGGSVSGDVKNKRRPLIIAAALAISLFFFTLALKATTLLIDVPPQTYTYISGGIIILLGIITLFPSLYARVVSRLGIEQRAQSTLSKGFQNKDQYTGPIIIGAALGPVFSSCSPVYAYILATVLPANFVQAMLYVVAYIFGLAGVLMLIGYYGQRFVNKIRFASDPKGWFQRAIAVLFIVVGLLIVTGYDKRFQTWISAHTPFNFDSISSQFIPDKKHKTNTAKLYNVSPFKVPEITGEHQWINSKPLTFEQLRGKVVLVDFWTYSCINCIRNNPHLVKWYNAYKDKGLVVIGVHAPEFAFEQKLSNVQQAVKQQGIPYPVVLDNQYAIWGAFGNNSWPTSYLIDANGNVRRIHDGEGEYGDEETAIRQLLTDAGADLSNTKPTEQSDGVPISRRQTPETYLGSARANNFVNDAPLAANPITTFKPSMGLQTNYWTLGGTWQVGQQTIVAKAGSTLSFHVAAKEVYLVMGATKPASIKIELNGKPISPQGYGGADVSNSQVTVGPYRLYRLVKYPSFNDSGTLTLHVPSGVELNAFTFGS